jgi:hypothetical protein
MMHDYIYLNSLSNVSWKEAIPLGVVRDFLIGRHGIIKLYYFSIRNTFVPATKS